MLVRNDNENPERLAGVLCGLGARIWTDASDLDVTFCPSGTSAFSYLKRDAINIERLHILVACLADGVRSKEAAGRAKDRGLPLPRLRRLLDRLQGDE